jgi:hypothetical protein
MMIKHSPYNEVPGMEKLMANGPVDLVFDKFTPNHAPATLHHYCSTATFMAIVASKSIRLSALSMSNDSEEGRLVLRLTEKLGEINRTDSAVLASLKAHWNEVVASNEGLGFCLSERGDLLSQWRGYAAQGRGVSIGFSTEFLKHISVADEADENFATLEQVEYGEGQQLHEYGPTFRTLVNAIEEAQGYLQYGHVSISEKLKAALNRKLRPWMRKIYTFKNDGFAEEREWRMLALLTSEEQEACSYRAIDDKIVAFRELRLNAGPIPAIVSVTLGPKHVTPVDQVERMLLRHGIVAAVTKSGLTYR